MSLYPQWPSLTVIPDKGPPRWQSVRDTPGIIDEGEDWQFRLRCVNSIPGAKVEFRLTGGNSLANAGNWLRSFDDVCREGAEKVGLIFRKLTANTVPKAVGTFNCHFIVGPNYVDGAIATFRNTTRRNRKDDAPLDKDGNPGFRRMNTEFRNVSPSSENGTVSGSIPIDTPTIGSGALLDVRDTSRSPLGYPEITISTVQDDLVSSSPPLLVQDDIFVIKMAVRNSIPGTKIRMMAAGDPQPNDGQYVVDPPFRTEIARAGAEAGYPVFVPKWTPTTADQWFNGGIITIPDNAPANFDFHMRFRVNTDPEVEDKKLFYLFSRIEREGDLSDFDQVKNRGDYQTGVMYTKGDFVKVPSGRSFVYYAETDTSNNAPPSDETTYSNSYWRQFLPIFFNGGIQQKQFNPIPPRFWELEARTDGSTITYRFQGPTNFVGDTVDFISTNPPPGFDAALAQACHATAPIRYENGKLIAQATDKNNSSVTFTVPHTGSGKHSLRLANNTSGGAQPFAAWLVIYDACVYLTPPVMPPQPYTSYGINLAGGEFGDKYTADGGQVPYNGGRYYYPSSPQNEPGKQHQKMDYFFDKGCRMMRLPFTWNRIQPQLFGPLYYGDDGPFGQFTNHDMRRIIEAVDYWVGRGGFVMLDLHNYMSYVFPTINPATGKFVSEKVKYDSTLVPVEALIDVWVRLAEVFKHQAGSVGFGIANEPFGDGQSARRVADTMQAVTNAIRSRTDALNLIARATSRYSSCRNFVNNGDAAANLTSYDPANNHCIELHLYVDTDNSGTTGGACYAPNNDGSEFMKAATAWFAANRAKTGLRGYIGEFAGGDYTVVGQENCYSVVRGVYSHMKNNPDQWFGWATWGTGFKSSYPYNLEPIGYYEPGAIDVPNMKLLEEFL